MDTPYPDARKLIQIGRSENSSRVGKRENVRGRPIFVYYSYRSGEETDRPLPFLTDIRWGRIGTRIK